MLSNILQLSHIYYKTFVSFILSAYKPFNYYVKLQDKSCHKCPRHRNLCLSRNIVSNFLQIWFRKQRPLFKQQISKHDYCEFNTGFGHVLSWFQTIAEMRYKIYLWVTFIETLVLTAKAVRWQPWVGCKSRPRRRIISRQTEDKVMDVVHCRPTEGKR